MNKIMCLLILIISILFLSNSNCTAQCGEHYGSLYQEYNVYGASQPSFGFNGGPFTPHDVSCYVASFWGKVATAQSSWGGTINYGYRCPALNYSVGGTTGSKHMYGNAADVITNAGSYWLGLGGFAWGYYISGTAVHVDDRLS